MKLGVMQPYFLPYIGYFDLINYTDKWVVFDTVQYIRHGWINRNRIMHPKDGWQYIVVPLKKHARSTEIKDIEVANDNSWKERIIGQLYHYKKKAPFFNETIVFVQGCLATNETSLSRLNAFTLSKACAYLGIYLDLEFFSEMNLKLGTVEGSGEWALQISEAIGAEEYVNPSSGFALFDNQKFRNSNIKLTFRNLLTFEYTCSRYEFIPNLSIVDLLMWNEPEKIKKYLDMHK